MNLNQRQLGAMGVFGNKKPAAPQMSTGGVAQRATPTMQQAGPVRPPSRPPVGHGVYDTPAMSSGGAFNPGLPPAVAAPGGMRSQNAMMQAPQGYQPKQPPMAYGGAMGGGIPQQGMSSGGAFNPGLPPVSQFGGNPFGGGQFGGYGNQFGGGQQNALMQALMGMYSRR